jgi:four helix bundle protein
MLSQFRLYTSAIRFYQLCKPLRLPAYAKDQLLRASSSVGNNIGEGYGRISIKDKKRFYRIALGSVRECQTIFAQEQIADAVLLDVADFLGGGLYKLVR